MHFIIPRSFRFHITFVFTHLPSFILNACLANIGHRSRHLPIDGHKGPKCPSNDPKDRYCTPMLHEILICKDHHEFNWSARSSLISESNKQNEDMYSICFIYSLVMFV